jgi:hypothetical protein
MNELTHSKALLRDLYDRIGSRDAVITYETDGSDFVVVVARPSIGKRPFRFKVKERDLDPPTQTVLQRIASDARTYFLDVGPPVGGIAREDSPDLNSVKRDA